MVSCFSVVPSSNPRSRFVNRQLVWLYPAVTFICNICFLCFSSMPINKLSVSIAKCMTTINRIHVTFFTMNFKNCERVPSPLLHSLLPIFFSPQAHSFALLLARCSRVENGKETSVTQASFLSVFRDSFFCFLYVKLRYLLPSFFLYFALNGLSL